MEKSIYVCGPLTELPTDRQEKIKKFYVKIADLAQEVLGVRGFVPHEHYDPAKHANFEPSEVDMAERKQICELTSCLIAVPVAPSWGSGIEVEMAYRSNVPVVILCDKEKLAQKKVSRLLRGNPAVKSIISYSSEKEALDLLASELRRIEN